jgi:uncharacterized membrane protein YuzA (DUF378 family)
MSLSDELSERGIVPFASLLTLSIVSANRGVQLLGGPDLVTTIFGGYAGAVFAFAGVVGLASLAELLTGKGVVPDAWRL